MSDNRNLILAVALSIAVVFGWQYFVASPRLEQSQREQAATQAASGTATTPAGGSAAPAAGGTPGAATPTQATATTDLTRDAALAATPRVPLDTPSVSGSINLKGGRIDDLRLKGYRETVAKDSPTVILLSPSGGPDGYFAEFGWVGAPAGTNVPGPDTIWTAPDGAKLTPDTPVALTYDNGAGLTFKRIISIDPSYMFTVRDEVTNATGAALTLSPYGRVTRIGEPHVAGYYILHEGLIGWMGDHHLQELNYSHLKKEGPQTFTDVATGWLGITDKYWATAIVPRGGQPFTAHFAHVDTGVGLYQTDFQGAPLSVAPGASAATESLVFAGAKQVSIIDGYRDDLKIERFDLLIDWGMFWFFTKPLFYLIDYFYKLVGNFGVAILLVTVLVKAVFFPLANKSYKSMSAMKKVQPEMAAIRERFADDKVKQQQALMELYKKEKINPLAGCWPVLIQIPVFFSLYKVIFITIEMRHAPFFGWIQDLSAPDPTNLFTLFGLIPWSPPHLLMLGIWPIIMGITMFVQMRLNPAPTDPAQQVVFTWMPVIFTFMLGSFPAGLVIYWTWNNTLSIAQQYVIMRRQGVEVNLLGNIMEAFRKKPKPAEATQAAVAAPKASPAPKQVSASKPANGNKPGPKGGPGKPSKAKS
jgi:YidC/Oxa1 family membrane protein insertase